MADSKVSVIPVPEGDYEFMKSLQCENSAGDRLGDFVIAENEYGQFVAEIKGFHKSGKLILKNPVDVLGLLALHVPMFNDYTVRKMYRQGQVFNISYIIRRDGGMFFNFLKTVAKTQISFGTETAKFESIVKWSSKTDPATDTGKK
jgi:hypothetical protein